MKRFALLAALAFLCVPAHAQTVGTFTVVDSCSAAAATSCSAAGSHRAGDMAIIVAYRAGTATAPSLPASIANLTNGTSSIGAARAWRVGCAMVPTAASFSSGTWTNATSVGMSIIRGTGGADTASCASLAVGTVGAANNVSSATATFSSLTVTAGSVPLLLMGSSTSGQTCTPAGATNIAGATAGDVLMAVANATGNWTTANCTITSSVTTEIVIEIKAINHIPTCSSGCPQVAEYIQWGFTTQATLASTQDEFYHLDDSDLSHIGGGVGTGNTIACLGRYFPPTTGTTITATAGLVGDPFVITPTSMLLKGSANNGTPGTVVYGIELFNAGGYKNIHLHWNHAVFSRDFKCWTLYGVPSATDPFDGFAANMESSPALFNQAGSITPSAANDIFLVSDSIDGDNVGLINVLSYYAPYDNYRLEGTNQQGPAGYDVVNGGTGALNLGMVAYQNTANICVANCNNWGTAAMAFKASPGAGTAPVGMYKRCEVTDNSNTASYVKQLPCGGNLQVMSEAVYQITGITADTSGNTWNQIGPSTTLEPQQNYSWNYTPAQDNFRTITIANNTPSTPLSLHFITFVGAKSTANPVDTGVTTTTVGATVTAGFLMYSTAQTAKSSSNTSCSNNVPAGSNTGPLNFTPSVPRGYAVFNEETNEGPDCFGGNTNNQWNAVWFNGEEDTSSGQLDSSSGYGNLPYTTATAQNWTSYWANSLATGASGSVMAFVLYEAAPTAANTPTQIGGFLIAKNQPFHFDDTCCGDLDSFSRFPVHFDFARTNSPAFHWNNAGATGIH